MATKVNIGGGKLTARPGTYSIITSRITNQSPGLPYGNILIMDTGIGAGFGGGSGVAGELARGKESVYFFQTIQDYQGFLKGGKLWSLGKSLFKPKAGVNGVSGVYYVQARTTAAAKLSLALTNGTIDLKVRDEGLVGNGVLSGLNLAKGYAVEVVNAGTNLYKVKLWLGTYKGHDSLNNEDYGGVTQALSKPQLIAESPALNTFSALKAWMIKNAQFRDAFVDNGTRATLAIPGSVIATPSATDGAIPAGTYYYKITALNAEGETLPSISVSSTALTGSTSSVALAWAAIPDAVSYKIYRGTTANSQSLYFTSLTNSFTDVDGTSSAGVPPTSNTATIEDGAFVAGDLTNSPGYNLFAGGTEVYNSDDVTSALAAVRDLDYSFILSTEYGDVATATGVNNYALLDHILPSGLARFTKFLVIPGGYDESEFVDAVTIAETFDNEQVVIPHGGFGLTKRTGGFQNYDALDKAAIVLGRGCGLEPQTPWTFKSLDIDKEVHSISPEDEEYAIEKGILVTKYDDDIKAFVIGLDINSLQDNEFLINDNGTSYNIAVNRIKAQLNKEIVIEAKKRFFSGEAGPNRFTISEAEIVEWTSKTFLKARVAKDTEDNLILSYQNVTVERQQDNYFVTYEFIPNTEIKAIVFMGVMING